MNTWRPARKGSMPQATAPRRPTWSPGKEPGFRWARPPTSREGPQGINLCGGRFIFPGVLGTAIFKVFDMNVAKTGLSMKEALREGFEPIQAIVRGYGRAHIMPGGRESILKVVADQKSGRILGAQAMGEGPSDKFIDTVAMALQGRMTCDQLATADLAYSPPFSPALSPVIVAANVLLNKIEGKSGMAFPRRSEGENGKRKGWFRRPGRAGLEGSPGETHPRIDLDSPGAAGKPPGRARPGIRNWRSTAIPAPVPTGRV